jgi:hypothetical protein
MNKSLSYNKPPSLSDNDACGRKGAGKQLALAANQFK